MTLAIRMIHNDSYDSEFRVCVLNLNCKYLWIGWRAALAMREPSAIGAALGRPNRQNGSAILRAHHYKRRTPNGEGK